ncbi:MAG: RnfABCDGE type electron transport complex subunit B [Candidatus Omnitrophota bacterium]
MEILIPIISLGVLGLIFGIGLAFASNKFKVHVDQRLEKIHGLLPGANCGACGGAGCFGFAEAVLSGKSTLEQCRVTNDFQKEEIAKIIGRELKKEVKTVAVLHCNGGNKVRDKFSYLGLKDCVAANLLMGGHKECPYCCLGFGTCVKACPFGALKMSAEGLPVVNSKKCKACNKCVLACPKKIFSLIPVDKNVYIACGSRDFGKDTKSICSVGCIACKLCEKACKFDAVHVIDNLAVIDYNKCTSCEKCAKVCPVKCIKTA